jgi:hypothetical protein
MSVHVISIAWFVMVSFGGWVPVLRGNLFASMQDPWKPKCCPRKQDVPTPMSNFVAITENVLTVWQYMLECLKQFFFWS